MDFDGAADELYGLDPGAFVAARRDAVASARESGDRELARRLGELRKPTLTGWVLNQLVRAEPDGVERLLEVGAALAAAQQRLSRDEMRALSARRSEIVAALTATAADLASRRGRPPSEQVVREVGQSLTASLADPEIGAELRAGRVLGALSYSGFGPALLQAVPEPETDATPAEALEPEPDVAALREEALQAVARARERRDRARSETADARARVDTATRRVRELREELRRAEQEQRFAESAHDAAEAEYRDSETELSAATRRAAELEP